MQTKKICFTQRCAAELLLVLGSIELAWVVYAPNHEWSICDSHGGVLNQEKTRQLISGNKMETSNTQLKVIQQTTFKNTIAIDLDKIDQSSFDQKTVKGIKNYYCFRYYFQDAKLTMKMFGHYDSIKCREITFDISNGTELNIQKDKE